MLSLLQKHMFSQLETMGAATQASLSLTGTVCDLNVGVSTLPFSLDFSLLLVRWVEVLRQTDVTFAHMAFLALASYVWI